MSHFTRGANCGSLIYVGAPNRGAIKRPSRRYRAGRPGKRGATEEGHNRGKTKGQERVILWQTTPHMPCACACTCTCTRTRTFTCAIVALTTWIATDA
eukprot:9119520-Lingulodinium_polyedra.AAC.1